MSTTILSQSKLYGLFELDASGTVLYFRAENDEGESEKGVHITGLNFFEDGASFENVEDFRLRITGFMRGQGQADSFIFTCRFGSGSVLVKVLLARISERSNGNHTKSILVHIRQA
jgi:hypothetical protein